MEPTQPVSNFSHSTVAKIITIFFLLGGLYLGLIQNKAVDTGPISLSVPPVIFGDGEEVRVLGWKNYSNSDLGFSIEYPSSLEVIDGRDKLTVESAPPEVDTTYGVVSFNIPGLYDPLFTVRVEQYSDILLNSPGELSDVELNNLLDEYKSQSEAYNVDVSEIVIGGLRVLNHKFYSPTKELTDADLPEIEGFIIAGKKRVYTIEFDPREGFGEWLPVIVSTFRFLE